MRRGRPKGIIEKRARFKIQDVKPTLEFAKFDPIKESIKLFNDTNNEWLKLGILKEFFKYTYEEPKQQIDITNLPVLPNLEIKSV